MRILVAEDDDGLREVLVLGLEDAGYHVDAVERGDDAIDQLRWYEYDVAVIDWRMPGTDGIEVVRWARRHERPTGLLMLTARDAPPDRITGLDAGADDYLVKPFDPEELSARLRAVTRRAAGSGSGRLQFGDVTLDLTAKCAFVNGARAHLTAREWAFVEALALRAGRLVSKGDLEALVLGLEGEVSSNMLEVHVSGIRRKLGRGLIETVRGMGYRISA